MINFELSIFIDYAKGELLTQLCIFVPLLYHDVKIFPHKITALTKLNTDPNSRTCALQSVIHGFSFHFWQKLVRRFTKFEDDIFECHDLIILKIFFSRSVFFNC